MSQDIFAETNSVVLDLQASQAQTYERYLKKLAQLLKHADLKPYNSELIANLNSNGFLGKSKQPVGSTVGNTTLDWPDDPRGGLGLTLLLIWELGADPSYTAHFSPNFFYSGNRTISNIRVLTGQLITPFVRDYKIYTLSRGIP